MPIGEQVGSWITCKWMAHGRDLALPGTTFQVGFIREEKDLFQVAKWICTFPVV
jgi:hypothetical protein